MYAHGITDSLHLLQFKFMYNISVIDHTARQKLCMSCLTAVCKLQ